MGNKYWPISRKANNQHIEIAPLLGLRATAPWNGVHGGNFSIHLSSPRQLYTPLGAWIGKPYQIWQWFYDPLSDEAYFKDIDKKIWQKYTRGPHGHRPNTRYTRNPYTKPVDIDAPLEVHLIPPRLLDQISRFYPSPVKMPSLAFAHSGPLTYGPQMQLHRFFLIHHCFINA
jgi:hypothetical protein